MKYNSKKVVTIIAMICLIIAMSGNCFAHSGRTDSSGGHKDNKNKSGLGSYHYHCGGHPAHLHSNGVCPYSSNPDSSERTTTSVSSSSTITKPTVPSTVDVVEVKINENIESLEIGESKVLTVTIEPSNATDKTIIWKSSDENIVTVSTTGIIIAKRAGTVEITATSSNEKTSMIKINVKEEPKTENNDIIMTSASIYNDITNSDKTNNEEDSSPLEGVIALGLLGGGSYWGYKKYKEKSNG